MSNHSTTETHDRSYWIRSSMLTLLEKGFGLLFGLGLAMILWRQLTKAEYASWGVFLILSGFVEMGRSGMIQNALMRFVAMYKDDRTSSGHVQTSAWVISLLFSLVSSGLLILAMRFLATYFHAPQLLDILPIYFMVNFVMVAFFHANYVQQAHLEFRGIFWSTFFYRGVPFVWAVYCSLRQIPIQLTHLTTAMLLGAILGAMASSYYARPFFLHAKEVSMKWLKELMLYGRYVLGNNLSTMFYKNIDKLALSGLMGSSAFAVYDAAGKITQMVEVPSFSMASVVFPQSARAILSEGTEGIRNLYERSVGAILAFILPFILLCLVFAEQIVSILAGPEYAESAGVLRLTALFGLFLPFAVQFGTILDSTGRPEVNFWYTTATAVLNLIFSYLFIKQFGLYGAAFATLSTYSVAFIFTQRVLRKSYGISALRAIGYIPSFYKAAWQMISGKLSKATAA